MAPSFPSPEERTVASALLVLSTTTTPPSPSPSSPPKICSYSVLRSEGSEEVKSTSSSCLTDDASSYQILQRNNQLRLIPVAARFGLKKFKVVKKKRSEMISCSSAGDHRNKLASPYQTAKVDVVMLDDSPEEASSVSCLSSSSSAGSSAQSRFIAKSSLKGSQDRRGCVAGSVNLRRRAEAILELLSGGDWLDEGRIRQIVGDSPDTSKAVRMLLKLEKIRRSGTGGSRDPYIYTIA